MVPAGSPPPARGTGTHRSMDIRKKNLVLAIVIGMVVVGLYVYSIFHVLVSSNSQ